MKEGIAQLDLSDLNQSHYKSAQTFTNQPTAAQQILENEARALYLSASLLGDTIAEKREALEQIVDRALKHLYAAQ